MCPVCVGKSRRVRLVDLNTFIEELLIQESLKRKRGDKNNN